MTIKKIAKLAKTSPATVSLVLNNKWQKKVRPDIAKKVQDLARKNNFTPNVAGRSLVMKRNFRIAVCADSTMIEHAVMGAYSFHEQLGIISAELSKSSYSIDIIRFDKYADRVEDLSDRLKIGCDGVLFLRPAFYKIKPVLAQLSLDIPCIVVDCNLKSRFFHYIYTDMAASVKNVICSLIKLGHTRVGIVRGEGSDERYQEKLKGYKQALSLFRIKCDPEIIVQDKNHLPDFFLQGYVGAEKILNIKKVPTAVLCTDNGCAIGFIQYLNHKGVVIPDDIQVVGFGDEGLSMFSSPRLTYLRRPVAEMAKKAVEIVLNLIENKDDNKPLRYEFKDELVVQGTAF